MIYVLTNLSSLLLELRLSVSMVTAPSAVLAKEHHCSGINYLVKFMSYKCVAPEGAINVLLRAPRALNLQPDFEKGANIESKRIATTRPGQRYSPGVVLS